PCRGLGRRKDLAPRRRAGRSTPAGDCETGTGQNSAVNGPKALCGAEAGHIEVMWYSCCPAKPGTIMIAGAKDATNGRATENIIDVKGQKTDSLRPWWRGRRRAQD